MSESVIYIYILIISCLIVALVYFTPNTKDNLKSATNKSGTITTSNYVSNVNSNYRSNANSNYISNVNSNYVSNILSNANSNYVSNVNSNYLSNANSNYLSNVNSNYLSNVNSNYLSNANSNYLSNVNSNYLSNDNSNNVSNVNSNNVSNIFFNSIFNFISNINSNNIIGSNYSNTISGTLLTGIYSNDYALVYSNLTFSLMNDGSVSPQSMVVQNHNNTSKLIFLSSDKLTNLDTQISRDLFSEIYVTVEQVSDHNKGYVLSNIPAIDSSNFATLFYTLADMISSDTIFSDLVSNIALYSYDNYSSFLNYSANYYLANIPDINSTNFKDALITYITTNLTSNI